MLIECGMRAAGSRKHALQSQVAREGDVAGQSATKTATKAAKPNFQIEGGQLIDIYRPGSGGFRYLRQSAA
jgi:hypothetical protein